MFCEYSLMFYVQWHKLQVYGEHGVVLTESYVQKVLHGRSGLRIQDAASHGDHRDEEFYQQGATQNGKVPQNVLPQEGYTPHRPVEVHDTKHHTEYHNPETDSLIMASL